MVLNEGLFDHDIAEILVDPGIRRQQTLHDFLKINHATGYEFQRIIIPARDQMAFDTIVDILKRGLSPRKVDLPVILESDFGKHHQRLALSLGINLRRIASDISCILQFFSPHQAGAGAEVQQF